MADTRLSLQSTDAGGGAAIGLIALIARDPELAACHAVQCSAAQVRKWERKGAAPLHRLGKSGAEAAAAAAASVAG